MPAISITTALLIAGVATAGTGTVLQARAAKKAGTAGQAAANAEADLQDYNAAVADLAAQDALERGDVEANQYRSHVRGIVGAQRASFAAQGVDVSSGTPIELQADTAAIGEQDALQIRSNATHEAWGYQVEAYDSRMRAFYARREGVMLASAGRSTAAAAVVGGIGGALSAGTNYAAMRYGFPSSGAAQSVYRGDALVPAMPRA